MPKGGPRKGAGRPKGSITRVSVAARAAEAQKGLLPHEWLAKVGRGEPIEQSRWEIERDEETGKEISRKVVTEMIYPPFEIRQDCWKAAAPFLAPKLAVQTIDLNAKHSFEKATDAELDAKLASLGVLSAVTATTAEKAQAGDGEGEEE